MLLLLLLLAAAHIILVVPPLPAHLGTPGDFPFLLLQSRPGFSEIL